ncbi:MAG: radical SAM family heme chaperone HemW [Atopobiaceae bacterium]|nr:radical SAM family heme chaperone HemW [Atopobiaceae bacterium]
MAVAACGVYEASWLARLHAASAQALYLHLPFCVRKCAYCDFTSFATGRDDPAMETYTSSLEQEVTMASNARLLECCETAYLGGGTPTMLGPKLLARLVSLVLEAAPRINELTVEANPDSLSDETLAALVDAGTTRVSIGVQNFDDAELRALGRVHDAQTARDRVAASVSSGLDVSLDLMCATPLQTEESWKRSLEQAISLGVCHVSVYPLQIEEGTPLAKTLGEEEPDWNAPEVQASRMELAAEMLAEAGFARYEVASYALPGKACRHNQAYWNGHPYLGLGVSAASMLTREGYGRMRNAWPGLPSIPSDISRIRMTCEAANKPFSPKDGLPSQQLELELLTEGQAAAEDLMLGMRRTAGIDSGLIAIAGRVLGEDRVNESIDTLVDRGLATWRDGRLVPTHEGWLLGNELYGALWELSEGEVLTLSVQQDCKQGC